jgi:hypothetical protein
MPHPQHIPDDVWLHIAEFIPQQHLQHLFSVNRSFFQAAMNARYRTVNLHRLKCETFKLLVRLQSVSFVAYIMPADVY